MGFCVLGADGVRFHLRNISSYLNVPYFCRENEYHNVEKYDKIYIVGAYMEAMQKFWKLGMLQDKRRILLHWIGSDINQAESYSDRLEIYRRLNITHLCEFEPSQERLERVGIYANIVYLPLKKIYDIMPLPKLFSVATYLPENRRPFFNENRIFKIAAMVPDISFEVFGLNNKGRRKSGNMRFTKYEPDLKKILRRNSVLLRIPQYDGLSLIVLEFLSAGRRVLWIHDFDYVDQVDYRNLEQIAETLTDIRMNFKKPMVDAHNFVAENFFVEKFVYEILSWMV